MTIDAHHHVWDLTVRPQGWIDPVRMGPIHRSFGLDDLAGPATSAGVRGTVLVQTVPVAAETPEFLALADASELILGVVGWVDLTDPAVADRIAELRAGPGGRWLVSIRHGVQGEPDPDWLCRPDVRRGLAAVADAGLAYDLLLVANQLPAAARTAAELPGLRFVLDHLGKPPIAAGELGQWSRDLAALAASPNVAAKLSGLVTEADWTRWTVEDLAPFARTALHAFGPHRLMFGSDWPVCLLASSYERWLAAAHELTADLSAPERDSVFAGCAREWYGLERA
ncbi:amidohydrolase family protein [Rugosimonospora acidiphila]|uniref:Amidohydrolase family protein n=1 Tax=Rugosimonospora acidiphila TaxID=556531 RepID=A0ABP9S2U1_9ACTN